MSGGLWGVVYGGVVYRDVFYGYVVYGSVIVYGGGVEWMGEGVNGGNVTPQ